MRTVVELDERLARPRPALVDDMRKLDGDLLVLGAGGKLGPSLVRLALRAVQQAGTHAKVIAVSRFSDPGVGDALRDAGAEVVIADLADDEALERLPDAQNIVFLTGAKFGTVGREHATWFTNAYLPGRVAQRFAGTRIAAVSTGNVYPLVPVVSGGCTEETPLAPVGEYAMSCLGRERVLTHVAERTGTAVALLRLNYAVELRYGVLLDLASAVLAGEPIDVTMGHVNVVWQGYANEVVLRSLLRVAEPPFVLNVAGPETASVRQLATEFGQLLGRNPALIGAEAATALLSNAARCHGTFGYPELTLAELMEWTAAWVGAGGPTHGKPTHFSTRDGTF